MKEPQAYKGCEQTYLKHYFLERCLELFGGPIPKGVDEGEEAILDFYQQRLKSVCGFRFATRTRVLMPLRERTFFYLVYATSHRKGLMEFRKVEKRLRKEQEGVRADVKQTRRIEHSGQGELFRDADIGLEGTSFRAEEQHNLKLARSLVLSVIDAEGRLEYEDVYPALLELPTIDDSAAKRIVRSLHDEGLLRIEGLKGRQRLPGPGCRLVKPE